MGTHTTLPAAVQLHVPVPPLPSPPLSPERHWQTLSTAHVDASTGPKGALPGLPTLLVDVLAPALPPGALPDAARHLDPPHDATPHPLSPTPESDADASDAPSDMSDADARERRRTRLLTKRDSLPVHMARRGAPGAVRGGDGQPEDAHGAAGAADADADARTNACQPRPRTDSAVHIPARPPSLSFTPASLAVLASLPAGLPGSFSPQGCPGSFAGAPAAARWDALADEDDFLRLESVPVPGCVSMGLRPVAARDVWGPGAGAAPGVWDAAPGAGVPPPQRTDPPPDAESPPASPTSPAVTGALDASSSSALSSRSAPATLARPLAPAALPARPARRVSFSPRVAVIPDTPAHAPGPRARAERERAAAVAISGRAAGAGRQAGQARDAGVLGGIGRRLSALGAAIIGGP